MAWVAGADGCKLGWFRASRDTETGALRFEAITQARELALRPPVPTVLALDIPIGLTHAGPRACDRAARACLGRPRSSSVFPAPIRPALKARTREEASRVTVERDGRRVGAQAWALYPKILAVDEWLRSEPEARPIAREVSPELSFWAWNGERAMADSKHSRTGLRARRALAERWLGRGVLRQARGDLRVGEVADDDILDAIAVLWTATRIARGESRSLPEHPQSDALGLRMEIVY
jgi:predicted RNase H-like nuclease